MLVPTLRAAMLALDENRGVTRLGLTPEGADGPHLLRFMAATTAPKPAERAPEQEETRISRSMRLAQHLDAAAISHHIARRMNRTDEAAQLVAVGRDVLRVAGMISILPSSAFPRKQSPLIMAAIKGGAAEGQASFDNAPEYLQQFLTSVTAGTPDDQSKGSLFPNPAPPGEFLAAAALNLWAPQAFEISAGHIGSRRTVNPDPEGLLTAVAGIAAQSAGLTARLRGVQASATPDYLSQMRRLFLTVVELVTTGSAAGQVFRSRTGDPSNALRSQLELPAVGARALQLDFGVDAQHLLRATAAPVLATVATNLVNHKSEWSALSTKDFEAMRALGGVMWTALLRSGGDVAAFTRGRGSVKAGIETYKLTAAAGLPLRLTGPIGDRMFPPRSATAFLRTTFETPEQVLAATVQPTQGRGASL